MPQFQVVMLAYSWDNSFCNDLTSIKSEYLISQHKNQHILKSLTLNSG